MFELDDGQRNNGHFSDSKHVTAGKHMATFDSLPDSLLISIFDAIKQYDIVLELRLVCRRWNDVITNIGLGSKRLLFKRFPQKWGSFQECKRKLSTVLRFYPLLKRIDFDNFYQPISIFESPKEQIEFVTFTLSGVKPVDLLAFVRMCPNLKSLGIYYEFNLNDRCLMETIKMLPKLECFEIDAAFRFDLRGRFFASLLNIQRLYIDLGQPVLQTQLQLLVDNNSETLKVLAMKPVEFRHLRTFGISFRNLEELRILRFQRIRPPPNDFYDFSGLKNLKLLHICAWNQRDQDVLTELVDQLLSASSQIKDLKIPFRPLNARNLLGSIIQHCPSLTKLTLLSPDLKDEDCHLFESLPLLEHLIITGYYHSLTTNGKETILRSCPRMNPKNLIFTHEREISIMISSNTGSIRDFGLGFHFQEL